MEDLKKMDNLTQFRLTNDIEKAASIALASEQDRSEILAKQLTTDNIPKYLDKTATQAYNRRISVATIGRRKEEDKADDFPLADFNKVAALRGHEEGLAKAASVEHTPFVFQIHKPEMKKVASAPVIQKPLKDITPLEVIDKIQNYLQKEAAAFENQQYEYLKEDEQLRSMVKRAAEMLSADTKTSKLLSTVYGDTYTKLFTGKISEEALKKHASYAILPKSPLVQYVQKTIKQSDVVDVKHDLLILKAASLKRIAKETDEIQEKLKKLALSKEAAGAGYTMLKDIAANAVSVPVNALIAGTKGAVGQSEDLLRSSAPFLNSDKSYSPGEAVPLSLLSKDRYQDKRMRLIDMLSNPDFAQYPAAEIEKAVEDTIATNQDMASPKMREYLKAEVGSRLLAGNRTNKADLAATADILKKITEAEKNRKEMTPEAVAASQRESSTGGNNLVLPELKSKLDKIDVSKLQVKDIGSDFDKLLDQIKLDREAREADYEARRKDRMAALEGYMDLYRKTIRANMLRKPNVNAANALIAAYNRNNPGNRLPYVPTKGKVSIENIQRELIPYLEQAQAAYYNNPANLNRDMQLLGTKRDSKKKKTP